MITARLKELLEGFAGASCTHEEYRRRLNTAECRLIDARNQVKLERAEMAKAKKSLNYWRKKIEQKARR